MVVYFSVRTFFAPYLDQFSAVLQIMLFGAILDKIGAILAAKL